MRRFVRTMISAPLTISTTYSFEKKKTEKNLKKDWTKADDRILLAHYKRKSGTELAWLLKKPLYTVMLRARELGIKIKHPYPVQVEPAQRQDKYSQKSSLPATLPAPKIKTKQNKGEYPPRKSGVNSWTSQEDKVLRKYYKMKPVRLICRMLRRTEYGIINRAGELGLRKKTLAWTPRELSFLKEHYPTKGVQFIANALKRSLSSVHATAQRRRINMKGRIRWTPKADAYLKRWYGQRKTFEIAKSLGTSAHAVGDRAWDIGVARKKPRPWTQEEIDFAMNSFPELTHKQVGVALGRTKAAVGHFYKKMKKRKNTIHTWTTAEKQLVRRLYNTRPIKELAERLHQPRQRVRALAYRMGLGPLTKGAPRYTEAERTFIRANYATMTYVQIAKKLKRPVSGIIDFAGKLGL